ncbi:MAG TPA: 50S ribosomal protein L6 [Candidatus Hydrogenedens sp.]|nr:50S ribosomal protein L6 [Candidatus Hydrogenedens sp.]HOK10178.1 50S ribosomal protein L6 [Candidatus Hydrogenedens sp.]HOL20925.1 50S ribosomal protein L6 [Candidatus Hydrogenedens sp.]HPP59726.1 50S ribosomal protein L6 [Candidatus Hydrogenedens sp.]
MSRIGKLPVPIPDGVKCELQGNTLKVTGPKGTLQRTFHPDVNIIIEDKQIIVQRPSDKKEHKALHGLTRVLIHNMIIGVTQGYQKTLLIEGVGYRASLQGKNLNMTLGFSHPVSVEPPPGITFTVDNPQTIRISGIDKELVGQVAADIRALRKPEPYKGKGIRYDYERIRRKETKSGK